MSYDIDECDMWNDITHHDNNLEVKCLQDVACNTQHLCNGFFNSRATNNIAIQYLVQFLHFLHENIIWSQKEFTIKWYIHTLKLIFQSNPCNQNSLRTDNILRLFIVLWTTWCHNGFLLGKKEKNL